MLFVSHNSILKFLKALLSSTKKGTSDYNLSIPQLNGDLGVTTTSTAPVIVTPDTGARNRTSQPGNGTTQNVPTTQRFEHYDRTQP